MGTARRPPSSLGGQKPLTITERESTCPFKTKLAVKDKKSYTKWALYFYELFTSFYSVKCAKIKFLVSLKNF